MPQESRRWFRCRPCSKRPSNPIPASSVLPRPAAAPSRRCPLANLPGKSYGEKGGLVLLADVFKSGQSGVIRFANRTHGARVFVPVVHARSELRNEFLSQHCLPPP